jgi:cell division protein FtsX
MGQVLHSIRSKPGHSVEIVVHVSEDLEEGQRSELVNALAQQEGISSAEFCTLRNHLMLIRYDRDRYSSQDVLASVRSQHLHAKLIGPV